MGAGAWRREGANAVVLIVHVAPGAKRTEAAGMHGAALKVRVAAPPADGKANAELRRFVAAEFGVPVSRVTIERGETSRQKSVRVDAPTRTPGWLSG